jgi:hypothetical protein
MVKVFRAGLALDERRAKFQPVYRVLDEDERKQGLFEWTYIKEIAEEATKALQIQRSSKEGTPEHDSATATLHRQDIKLLTIQIDDPHGGPLGAKFIPKSKEVWFIGAHSDVGGGNDLNGQPSLSNISFR